MLSLLAQVYNGGGIEDGIDQASGITGVADADPREVAISIIEAVLNFLALIATIMVIAAGIYMIVSLGNDDNKEKAKKIIYYTIIGLVVVLFARVIVSLFTEWLPSQVG